MKRVLVAVLGVLLCLTACSSGDEANYKGTGVPSQIDNDLRDEPDWRKLEKALNKDPASVMAPEALKTVGGVEEFRDAIVEGTIFKVHDATWSSTRGAGGVVIEERTPSGVVIENFAIMMEDIDRNWWIQATMDVDSAIETGLYVPAPVDPKKEK